MVTGNPCSNGRIRLIKDPALKQALSVSGIKAGIEHDDFLYNTKLIEYSLNNQKIIKDLLILLVYKKPVLFVVLGNIGYGFSLLGSCLLSKSVITSISSSFTL